MDSSDQATSKPILVQLPYFSIIVLANCVVLSAVTFSPHTNPGRPFAVRAVNRPSHFTFEDEHERLFFEVT
ncbi:hypothetical protein SISNIDRAFT_452233 [Sistotremastrum niveocremeum HHB9708]|uniref:Uncharacterized protein n=1 Tax=Sistotremastrum niveocremeum HHB9708 TaxID=1314777 RepID=A0A164X2C6_9AGAM|nr:hypothetical protein SISNIDRAFT_452233 [Sistotremastrum niveocremeum HHB9708]